MKSLSEFLLVKRGQLDLSQMEASKLIGISREYLSVLEKSTTTSKPQYKTIRAIAKAYSVPLDELAKIVGYEFGVISDEEYEIAYSNGISKKLANDRFYKNNWTKEKTITKPPRCKRG